MGALPTSFRRNRETAAAQGATVSGDPVASTNIQVQAAPPAKDWFVRNDYPTNTRAVYEELERYDKLLVERKSQELPTTLSGATTKNLNNKRRIQEQVLFLMEQVDNQGRSLECRLQGN